MVTDPKLASDIIAACRECNAGLNTVLVHAQSRLEPAEFDVVREGIAKALGAIFLDVMDPIFRRHPDLVPDDLRSTYSRHQ